MSTLQEPPLTEQTGGLRRNLKAPFTDDVARRNDRNGLIYRDCRTPVQRWACWHSSGLFISRWDNAGDDDVSWRIIVRVSPLWLISALCIDVYSKPDLELYHRVAILV